MFWFCLPAVAGGSLFVGPATVTRAGFADTDVVATGCGDCSFGIAVAHLGDSDGDGFDDLAIGGHTYSVYQGYVGVFGGSSEGVTPSPNVDLIGPEEHSHFGYAVGGAGDTNGDGFSDLLVGAYEVEDDAGVAYIFDGGADGPAAIANQTWSGLRGGDYFGWRVASAGDVNGDSFSDVLVTAPGFSTRPGEGSVFLGGAGGVDLVPAVTLLGDAALDYLGLSADGGGDVDGDGLSDMLLGGVLLGEYGGVAIYAGSTANISPEPSWLISGTDRTYFGGAVSDAGDTNADGYADILIGDPRANDEQGAAYVHLGSPTGPDLSPATTILGPGEDIDFAETVAGGGDLDGDGYGDIAVGAPDYDRETGLVQVFFGSAAGILPTPDLEIHGPETLSYFGGAIDLAGDTNADGFDDLVVGSFKYNGWNGRVDVYYGAARDLDGDEFAADVDCDDADAAIHPEATEVCDGIDQDCDGVPDDDPADGLTWYADADGDAFGDGTSSVTECSQPVGAVADGADCDDTRSDVNPSALEVCDGLDDDCDGLVDDDDSSLDPASRVTWYDDLDGDGHGDPDTGVASCGPTAGSVRTADDCDDDDAAVHPDAVERCGDDLDDDCDPSTSDACEDGEPPKAGCGCRASGGAPPMGAALALALLFRRRGWRGRTCRDGSSVRSWWVGSGRQRHKLP